MEQKTLTNPQLSPTPELLQKMMGDNYVHFEAVMSMLAERGVVAQWNYYKDGKSWLCKAQYKKKTVLWLSVWDDCFKLSFYFTEKTRGGIDTLGIDSTIKEAFRLQKTMGKLIPLVLVVRDGTLLNDLKQIIEYKMRCK